MITYLTPELQALCSPLVEEIIVGTVTTTYLGYVNPVSTNVCCILKFVSDTSNGTTIGTYANGSSALDKFWANRKDGTYTYSALSDGKFSNQ